MNVLIENIKGIAKLSLTRGYDWDTARSIWEAENPDLTQDVTPDDRSVFFRYVNGKADEEGNAINGQPIRFTLDENGDITEA